MTESLLAFAALILIGSLSLLAGIFVWRKLKSGATATPHLPVAIKARSVEELVELLPESRYVEAGGGKVHYIQAGHGPDVVLLHGIGASVYVWRFLFPILQARHRVTALDLPGFGKSEKSWRGDYGLDVQCKRVQQALNALGIENAHLVGSSMGGAIALWLGKIAPERFSKLAVLAPATDSSLIPNQARYLSGLAPVLRHAVNRRTMKVLLSAVVTKKELITEQVTDAYLRPFMDGGDAVAAFWGATALLADPRLPSALAGHTGDIAVIYGEKDRMVSRASIDRLLTLIPHATFIVHPDGGHHLMEDEPAWTAKQLEVFFSTPPHDNSAPGET